MPPTDFLRRRESAAPVPLAAHARLLLDPRVTFVDVAGRGERIAMLSGVPVSRVSAGTADLLCAMNGETTLSDLHRRFAASESEEDFLGLVERFRRAGLVAGGRRRPPGRVVYRPPLTVQIATLHAPAIFRRLDRLVLPLPRRAVLVGSIALLGLGMLAAVLQAHDLVHVVTAPVPVTSLVIVVVVLSLVTVLHEAAHGLTLTRFGGSPRRAGFMLLYLTPAFFVDVTDGWRLPDRRHRVAIALAGPAVHAVIAAVALLAALAVPHPVVHQALLLLALSATAVVSVNLIPFVRFDGYIALMSALDEPNLRARAMRDGANALGRGLFGGRRTDRSLDVWWGVPFGLASIATPIVLVAYAVIRVAHALAGGGPLLGLFVVALEAVIALVGVVLLMRALRRVLRAGVSRLRFVAVIAAATVSIAVSGALIPVPVTATLGFSRHGDHVDLLRAGANADTDIPEGARVLLMTNGILANERVGEGTVGARRRMPTEAPLDAFFPVRAEGATVPALIVAAVDVSGESVDLPAAGQARVELGARDLWRTIWMSGVMLPLSALKGTR